MEVLVARTRAGSEARERTKVILLTLAGAWSVARGAERLGVGRTRFGVLRRRMLHGATAALEARAAGRPPHERAVEDEATTTLRGEVARLEHELGRLRVELDLARSGAGAAIERRRAAKAVRR
jgi:hypothetical protein